MKARCRGGAAAWGTGVLAASGTQGSYQLGKQEIQCSRRVWQSLLASTLQYSFLKNLIDREAWKATVHVVIKSHTQPRRPCMHRCKPFFFFACGSSAPVRVEHEGGTAAEVMGSLAVPSVQGHRLPQLLELWPYQCLFSSLW